MLRTVPVMDEAFDVFSNTENCRVFEMTITAPALDLGFFIGIADTDDVSICFTIYIYMYPTPRLL